MAVLTFDIGNYRAKLALISEGGEIIHRRHFHTSEVVEHRDMIVQTIEESSLEGLVIGSVIPEITEYLSENLAEYDPLFVDGETDTELVVEYYPRKSLGADRLAAAAGVFQEYGKVLKRDIMIIDAGTTVTADLVSAGGTYLGGAIFPGDDISIKALAKGTKQLPEIVFESSDTILGSNTRECMLIGVRAAIVGAIEHLYHRYGGFHGDNPFMIMTGASAAWLSPELNIPHMIDPDIVLLGLAAIWSYNKE